MADLIAPQRTKYIEQLNGKVDVPLTYKELIEALVARNNDLEARVKVLEGV